MGEDGVGGPFWPSPWPENGGEGAPALGQEVAVAVSGDGCRAHGESRRGAAVKLAVVVVVRRTGRCPFYRPARGRPVVMMVAGTFLVGGVPEWACLWMAWRRG